MTIRRLVLGVAAYVLVGFLYGFLSAAWQERHLLLQLLRGLPPAPQDRPDATRRWWCTNCVAPNQGPYPCQCCGAASPLVAHEYVQRLR